LKYFKEMDDLPAFDLMTELTDMIAAGKIKWNELSQICINTTSDHPHDPFYGAGSLDLDYARKYEEIDSVGNNKIIVPPREQYLREEDFTQLVSVFEGTKFEDFYRVLTAKFAVGRVRVMKMRPNHSMSWHKDYNNRIHYPLKTQTGCFMVIDDEIAHLEQNKWYYTVTQQFHTAFNGSREDRTHIVACLFEDKK
tara:strand:- start:6977 stop:7561 length:585 start_codon:yes stop_codon:yes gene_type:complete